MLAAHDWMPTLAGLVGESDRMPKDRPIDGIDASAFMFGTSKTTGRSHYLFFATCNLHAQPGTDRLQT